MNLIPQFFLNAFSGTKVEKTHGATNEILGLHTTTLSTPPKAGAKQIISLYNNLPSFRSVVDVVGDRVAQTNWTLHVPRNSRDQKVVDCPRLKYLSYDKREKYLRRSNPEPYSKSLHLEQLESHPALDVLGIGNSLHPGGSIMRLTQTYIDLTGEAFWQLVRNGAGMPVEIFILNPTWIRKLPSLDDPFYTRRTNRSIDTRIPEADIIPFIQLNPVDPYARGSGLGMALGDELEIGEFSNKHLKSFFYNSARADFIISAPNLREEDEPAWRMKWLNDLQGFLKAHTPFFTNLEIKVHELSQDFKSMQMTDLIQLTRDITQEVFKIPPEALGKLQDSNRATAREAERNLIKNVIEPRQEMIRNILQTMFIPQFDTRLILGFESQVPDDREFKLQAMSSTPSAFWINEHRALADRPELEDDLGKVFPTKFNEVASPTPGGLAPAEPDTDNSDESRAFKPAETKQTADEERIDRVIAAVIAADLYDPMKSTLLNTIQEFGQRAIDNAGLEIAFDINDPNVVRYIDEVGFNKVKNLTNETTRNALRRTLSAGLEAGESVTSLAKRINATFLDATSRRAFTIARTEIVAASSFGTLEGFKAAGVERKQWISTRGPNVRDTHKVAGGMDGQIVNSKDDFKSPSGAEGPGPGLMGTAAENVNCQCDILPIFDTNQNSWGANADTEEKRLGIIKAIVEARAPFEESLRGFINQGFGKQNRKALAALRRT